ncbi:MAG TPA: mandelate racemase/muconate lactonizing enzyme family protein [Terriglobales bacterium]|nr:mandelate racemase/muconate lactonizing enzyme family protein [Terriglobales bacterium]
MVDRRDLLKLGGTTLAVASIAQIPSLMAQTVAEGAKGMGPLTITKVEAYIVRTPKDQIPEEQITSMPPIGATNEGVGLWKRLDLHSPSRFKKYTQLVFVKITTNQGLVGWGEAHAPAAPRVHKTVITDLLAPVLVGEDARNVEVLWERMYSTQRLRGYSTGFFLESIAAVDLALWDLLGKYLNVPVYRLLGGKYRDEIPTYIWVRGDTPTAIKEDAAKALESGYTVLKMGLGGRPDTGRLDRVEAVSEVLKSKGQGQVITDSLGAFKLYEAIKLGRELDQMGNIGWWEDPLMPEDYQGYVELSAALDTAICKGEVLSNRFQMRDMAAAKAVDISNVDICRAGGISESKKMAMIADLYGLMWTPHVSTGSLLYMSASIHLGVATPNCLIMEYQGQAAGPLGNVLAKEPLEFRPGFAKVPERPGLGVEFDERELAKITIG